MEGWRFYPRYEPRGESTAMPYPTPAEKLLRGIFGPTIDLSLTCSEVNGVTLRKAIDSVLSELTEREREVIRMRFGFNDSQGKGQPLAAIGKKYGVERERIRQIEGKALRKLRWHGRSCKLRPYVR